MGEEVAAFLVVCKRNKRRKGKQKQTKNFADNLPDELLTEVFLRLPNCKSAIQCLLVSKQWSSLISNPHFIRSFNDHHHNSNLPFTIFVGLPHNYPIPFSIYSIQSHNISPRGFLRSSNFLNFLPNFPKQDPWLVRASHDDLLLVSSRDEQLYICNPLTKKYVALPNPDLDLDSQLFYCKYGLVVTNSSYDYKVILIRKPKTGPSSYKLIAAIYCSNTLKWCTHVLKSPQKLLFYPEDLFNTDVVVACNGLLHWIDVRSVNYRGILVLDPKHMCLYYMNRPAEICGEHYRRNEIFMGSCQGRLRMSFLDCRVVNGFEVSYFLRVWELMNYDNDVDSWCLKHQVWFNMELIWIPFMLAFNPTDADIVFLVHKDRIYECSLTNFNMEKQVGKFPYGLRHPSPPFELFKYQSLPLVHPAWPTPVTRARILRRRGH